MTWQGRQRSRLPLLLLLREVRDGLVADVTRKRSGWLALESNPCVLPVEAELRGDSHRRTCMNLS